ncbi:MAG: hypothetical protein WC208_12560 [Gallionella sp.]|jgi:hypothetical protein
MGTSEKYGGKNNFQETGFINQGDKLRLSHDGFKYLPLQMTALIKPNSEYEKATSSPSMFPCIDNYS